MSFTELAQQYFHLGLRTKEIALVLERRHGIIRSSRQILRILHNNGLFRRHRPNDPRPSDDLEEAATFIENQLKESGQMLGYRMMHIKCQQHGLRISRDTVYGIMSLLDPEGVASRLRHRLRRRTYYARGPNHLWHIDGYDKLKPYGICIHGCIDGYSRELIWLEAYQTNNDPKVIASYYIEAVTKKDGCPLIVRADCGTENVVVEMLQRFLRRNGQDEFAADKSFLYGRSTSNQRIEFWWSILRKECAQFWMNFFKQISDEGFFSGDEVDKGLVQYCFMKLIQDDLDSLAMTWSNHNIRRSRNAISPGGRPALLHNFPELLGTTDQLQPVDSAEVMLCVDECVFKKECPCDPDLGELCSIIMQEHGWVMPQDSEAALDLYLDLRRLVSNNLS